MSFTIPLVYGAQTLPYGRIDGWKKGRINMLSWVSERKITLQAIYSSVSFYQLTAVYHLYSVFNTYVFT